MKRILTPALITLALAACGQQAAVTEGAAVVQAEDAWCRPTPNGVYVGGCYVTLVAGRNDRLVAVSTPVSPLVEIHEMRTEDGMMRMGALTEGLPLPAGKTITLRPGAEHIMLMALSDPLAEGETINLTLTFETAAEVTVAARIRRPEGATADHEANGH